jgi:serpin B
MSKHPLAAVLLLTTCLVTQSPPAAAAPKPDDQRLLAETFDSFGADVADKLAKPGQNLCFSPASLCLCLSMLLPGANGETLAELQKALCPKEWDGPRATAAMPALLTHLHDPRKIELSVVHDLWPQAGHPLLPDFLAAMHTAFGAEVRPLDYARHTELARKTINDHVAKATKGRILELLDPTAIETTTLLVLTNALYFKADWLQPFPAEDTRDGPFHLPEGVEVKVPLMHLHGTLACAEVDGVQVVRLPYVDPDYAFDAALPAAGDTLATAEIVLQPDGMAKWTEAAKLQPVLVTLPRFRIEGSFHLCKTLRALGLVRTTTRGEADFRGIDGGAGQLFVDEVVQKTFLEVGENGTEAAAATAMVGKGGRRQPQAKAFQADRPFAYALRDLKTGLVLFAGRVVDPRAQ